MNLDGGQHTMEDEKFNINNYHSCVTIGGKDSAESVHDIFEFDKFVKADTKTCDGFSSKDRDSTIHFHTGYSIPANNPPSVAINNTVVLNDKAFIERKHVPRLSPIFVKQAVLMGLWFVTSFVTIVQNKYILSSLDTDPAVLGFCQIVMTTMFGCCMMYLPFGRCH